MDFVGKYGKEIIALLVPFITWLLNVGVKAKAKLISASPHAFTFIVPEPLKDANGKVLRSTQSVCTASVKVVNVGRASASSVELAFNWKPQFINLWPVRHFQERVGADGRYFLVFDRLLPKEEIGVEIMSINGELPALLAVRSNECSATNVPLRWVKHFPAWKSGLIIFCAFVGLGTVVYWSIALFQFLILKTPFIG